MTLVHFIGGPLSGTRKEFTSSEFPGRFYLTPVRNSPGPVMTASSWGEGAIAVHQYRIVPFHTEGQTSYFGIGEQYGTNVIAALLAGLQETADLLGTISRQLGPRFLEDIRLREAAPTTDDRMVIIDDPVRPDDSPEPSASDWDTKLKQELARGDDTWGAITRKFT